MMGVRERNSSVIQSCCLLTILLDSNPAVEVGKALVGKKDYNRHGKLGASRRQTKQKSHLTFPGECDRLEKSIITAQWEP